MRPGVSIVLAVLLLAGCGSAQSHTTTTATAATAATSSQTRPAPPGRPVTATVAANSHSAPAKRRRPDPVAIRRARASAAPTFRYEVAKLSRVLREQLQRTSWHPGCPVGLGRLRYLRIGDWGFDRRTHLGEMVVNASAVTPLRRAFAALFAARFPIRRMRLVDRYGGSDYASIQADNTSAFNCREATGSSRWSEHAYGLAIDINPIENPYVYANNTTTHPASDPYLDRADVRPGMAVAGGTLVGAFDTIGWGWGGRWPRPTDFQHFSVNGR
jgi:hypothetical protein